MNDMHAGKKRIYVDTTVVLGNFDKGENRRRDTTVFWNAVRSGEIVAIVSNVLDGELKQPSEHVRDFIAELPQVQIERIVSTDESDDLAEQYIAEKVVGRGSFNDCRHVALATIFADGIVSWNLGDMVKRADKYNSVNATHDYPEIKIVTPNLYKEIYNET
jgi:predicted nucleic acid-binding protein